MNQLKKSLRIMVCLAVSLLMLGGCGSSSSDKQQIEDLEGKVAELNSTVNDLLSLLSVYKNQSYENIYGGGIYQCQLETTYSLSIRFVAKTVVFFDGTDVDGMAIYHNYYLLQQTSTYNFDIVEDVNVADNWGPTNWAYIKRNGHFSRLEMSVDGKTLTLTPSEYSAVCTFVKD